MASFGRRGSGQGQRHWQPPHMVNSNGAGGVVDLTSSPPGLSRRRLSQQRRPRKRSAEGTSPQEGEQEDAAESSQRKRQRRELRDRAAELFGEANTEDEEDGAPGAQEELQQTELQQAVSNQQHEDSSSNNGRPLKIGQRTCIICMENYTDATVTACGHIYCHECLMKSLHHSAKTNNRNTGNCPACRKSIFITGKRKDTQIIPIAFMKKEVFKGRRR
ncbi:hypothetical protein K431DRAFT_17353 [Polychaeton citri CBS 116435]|uniref:RING-type domain-containing protein n=1 Tax=Polychaeton citri CBS 116435 TaxID=1314669 RepID=A0A9P4QAP6_9PEZI|nr:hypothetical protein K431DRAFT_17353 [Polychaeton citri CBS 116435]